MTSNPLPKHGPCKPGSVGKATGTVKVAILDDDCKVRTPPSLPPFLLGLVVRTDMPPPSLPPSLPP